MSSEPLLQSLQARAVVSAAPKSNTMAPSIIDEGEEQREDEREMQKLLESKLRRKVDLRLCSIAGILCSLNLLDSGIISSASVTTLVSATRATRCWSHVLNGLSMLKDLSLEGNRYVRSPALINSCRFLPGTRPTEST